MPEAVAGFDGYARVMSSAPRSDPPQAPSGSSAVPGAALGAVCPFLRSRDGAWSSAFPAVAQQCWAVRPAVPLAVAKQRDLCLSATHQECATYRAALAADEPTLGDGASWVAPDTADAASLWPWTRPVPVALEPIRGVGRFRLPDALGGQVFLVGLMTAALVIFVVARSGAPAGDQGALQSAAPTLEAVVTASPTDPATPKPTAVVTPSPAVTPSPVPTEMPTEAPTVEPTATPAPTPAASVRTYTVQKTDKSLYDIGQKLGIPWKKIADANGIKAPWTIHRGDVLILP